MNYSTSRKVLRVKPKPVATTENATCPVCDRQKTAVKCSGCSFQFRGRVSKECRNHPKVRFSQDMTECPKCKSTALEEEDPYSRSNKEPERIENCICERKCAIVYCTECGWFVDNNSEVKSVKSGLIRQGGQVRMQRVCNAHPKYLFHQDLKFCPSCGSQNLDEEYI